MFIAQIGTSVSLYSTRLKAEMALVSLIKERLMHFFEPCEGSMSSANLSTEEQFDIGLKGDSFKKDFLDKLFVADNAGAIQSVNDCTQEFDERGGIPVESCAELRWVSVSEYSAIDAKFELGNY